MKRYYLLQKDQNSNSSLRQQEFPHIYFEDFILLASIFIDLFTIFVVAHSTRFTEPARYIFIPLRTTIPSTQCTYSSYLILRKIFGAPVIAFLIMPFPDQANFSSIKGKMMLNVPEIRLTLSVWHHSCLRHRKNWNPNLRCFFITFHQTNLSMSVRYLNF